MASESVQSRPDEPFTGLGIMRLTQGIMASFEALLIKEDEHSRNQIDRNKLIEEYGRFKVWVEQSGAAVRHRGSLEESLQDDKELCDLLAGVLTQLQSQLERALQALATEVVAGEDAAAEESDYITSDSEYSSADSFVSDHEPARKEQKVSRVFLRLLHAYEQIKLLYHFSALLRRPKIHDRYLSSTSSRVQPATVPTYETHHVEEKFKIWAEDLEGDSEAEFECSGRQSKGKTPAGKHSRDDATGILRLRLAAANAQRRRQFRYWHSLPGGEMDGSEARQIERVAEGKSQASSGRTVRTFHTEGSSVARSAIVEQTIYKGPARTEYASSAFGDDGKVSRLPKVPVESLEGPTFQCPYCTMTLKSETMQVRNTWKRHVFRDLRPYTCTFADCLTPSKLYATRRDWIYHEMQVHRRQWVCRFCSEVATRRNDMAFHLTACHPGQFQENKRSVLVDMAERTVDEGSIDQCSFCPRSMSVKKLVALMGGHMEELSIFSLSRGHDDPPEDDSAEGDSEDEMRYPHIYSCSHCLSEHATMEELMEHKMQHEQASSSAAAAVHDQHSQDAAASPTGRGTASYHAPAEEPSPKRRDVTRHGQVPNDARESGEDGIGETNFRLANQIAVESGMMNRQQHGQMTPQQVEIQAVQQAAAAAAARDMSHNCDYPGCPREASPFRREDSYRDHLREFHREDLLKRGGEEDDEWFAGRNISPSFWRCGRCLLRNSVVNHDWTCFRCEAACESPRVKHRIAMYPSTGAGGNDGWIRGRRPSLEARASSEPRAHGGPEFFALPAHGEGVEIHVETPAGTNTVGDAPAEPIASMESPAAAPRVLP